MKRRRALSLVGPLKGKSLLDIGCGDGALLRQAPDDVGVRIGIDLSNEDFTANESKRIHFIVGDATRLPFTDSCFGAVVSTEVIEHLQPRHAQRMAREVHRVIDTNGKFCLTTPRGDCRVMRLCAFAPAIALEIILGVMLLCCSARYRQYFRALRATSLFQRQLSQRYGFQQHVKEYTEQEITTLLAEGHLVVRARTGTTIAPSWTRFQVFNFTRRLFAFWKCINAVATGVSRKFSMDICILCGKVQRTDICDTQASDPRQWTGV
jgi:ubiquinone/menaquinone biosynthesis C-methylase UbiE